MRPIAHLFQGLGVAAVALGIVSLQVRNEGVLKLLVFPYVRDKRAIFLYQLYAFDQDWGSASEHHGDDAPCNITALLRSC